MTAPTAADDIAGLVREEGRAMTVRVVTAGQYDPATGQNAPETHQDFTGIPGVWLGGGQAEVRGGLIQASAPRVLFARADLQAIPGTGDRILDGAAVYEIARVRVRELDGAQAAVVCELQGA